MQQEHLANGTPVFITQSHRFGQDALLLAHFCRVRRAEAVCDLGTGCGVIPLRWHDRGHRGPGLRSLHRRVQLRYGAGRDIQRKA